MIRAYVGNLGMGKTMRMVYDCMEEMKQGTKVISNVNIHFTYKKKNYQCQYFKYYEDFEHAILTAKSCIVAIDEANSLFDSGFRQALTREVKYKFMQSRHFGCDMYFTAQRFAGVNVNLRAITNEVMYCYKKRWFGQNRLPLIRVKYIPLLWRTFPRLKAAIGGFMEARKEKNENRLKYEKKKINWILYNLRKALFSYVPATLFVALKCDTYIVSQGRSPFMRKGFEHVRGRDVLYPSTYRFVWTSYSTTQVVRLKGEKRKKYVRKTAPITKHQEFIINSAKQAIALAGKELAN